MTPDGRRERKRSLRQLLENFGACGATNHPRYLEALKELERLETGLEIETSKAAVIAAAKAGRCLSMKDLAEANDVSWSKVHYAIGEHLYRLNCWAIGNRLPMLGAIVVNQQNVTTGTMEEPTLKGFIAAARFLKQYPPRDDVAQSESEFVAAEQRRVFEWASGGGA